VQIKWPTKAVPSSHKFPLSNKILATTYRSKHAWLRLEDHEYLDTDTGLYFWGIAKRIKWHEILHSFISVIAEFLKKVHIELFA
jgi:hypothetical protein